MRHRDPLATVINNAVNQVLSRTVVVSLTVILVLIPLTLAGGEVLHDFSLALLLGVIIGTYSSVFVASPLLDRKSTRLNSSHGYISYAVFCLKKKIHQVGNVAFHHGLPMLFRLS